jgi:hypothetical protein
MALDDIVIEADVDPFIAEIDLGTLNAPVDILTESGSFAGTAEAELVLFAETSHVFIF